MKTIKFDQFSQKKSALFLTFFACLASMSCPSFAQDKSDGFAQESIYQGVQKTILPFKPIMLTLDAERVFLYLHETQQLDRMLIHMQVKKDLHIDIISDTPENDNALAEKRLAVIRGYVADNGGDLSRIHFKAGKNTNHLIHIKTKESS